MSNVYSQAKIYCIRNRKNENSIVYIGSTVCPLNVRMNGHRKDMKRKPDLKIYKIMAEYGKENFHIELVCLYPCNSLKELQKEEGRHILLHETNTKGNTLIAGRDNKEYKKMYRDENKESIASYLKTYFDNHKATMLAQQKEYRLRKKAQA